MKMGLETNQMHGGTDTQRATIDNIALENFFYLTTLRSV